MRRLFSRASLWDRLFTELRPFWKEKYPTKIVAAIVKKTKGTVRDNL